MGMVETGEDAGFGKVSCGVFGPTLALAGLLTPALPGLLGPALARAYLPVLFVLGLLTFWPTPFMPLASCTAHV